MDRDGCLLRLTSIIDGDASAAAAAETLLAIIGFNDNHVVAGLPVEDANADNVPEDSEPEHTGIRDQSSILPMGKITQFESDISAPCRGTAAVITMPPVTTSHHDAPSASLYLSGSHRRPSRPHRAPKCGRWEYDEPQDEESMSVSARAATHVCPTVKAPPSYAESSQADEGSDDSSDDGDYNDRTAKSGSRTGTGRRPGYRYRPRMPGAAVCSFRAGTDAFLTRDDLHLQACSAAAGAATSKTAAFASVGQGSMLCTSTDAESSTDADTLATELNPPALKPPVLPALPARYLELTSHSVPMEVLFAAATLGIDPATVAARPTACLLPTPEELPQAGAAVDWPGVAAATERPRGRPRKHPAGFDGLGNSTQQTARKGIYRITYKSGTQVWRVTVYCQGRNRYLGTFPSEIDAIRAHDRGAFQFFLRAAPGVMATREGAGLQSAGATLAALNTHLILPLPLADFKPHLPLLLQAARLPPYLFPEPAAASGGCWASTYGGSGGGPAAQNAERYHSDGAATLAATSHQPAALSSIDEDGSHPAVHSSFVADSMRASIVTGKDDHHEAGTSLAKGSSTASMSTITDHDDAAMISIDDSRPLKVERVGYFCAPHLVP